MLWWKFPDPKMWLSQVWSQRCQGQDPWAVDCQHRCQNSPGACCFKARTWCSFSSCFFLYNLQTLGLHAFTKICCNQSNVTCYFQLFVEDQDSEIDRNWMEKTRLIGVYDRKQIYIKCLVFRFTIMCFLNLGVKSHMFYSMSSRLCEGGESSESWANQTKYAK